MHAPIEAIRQARLARDPDLARRIVALSGVDAVPDGPQPEDALTLYDLRRALFDKVKAVDGDEARKAFRAAQWVRIDTPQAQLPARLALHTEVTALWAANDAYSRGQLLRVIADVPLRWGVWKALKQIFKDAEERQDYEVYGALAARFDVDYAARRSGNEVRRATLGYLVRRAWRTLRRLGEGLPAVYADVAVDVLRGYPEGTNWGGTWIANHIFYHATGEYTRGSFAFRRRPSTLLKYRAFPELWRRTPRPLFGLLETANSEQARRFAAEALRSDFRATLRTVEPDWVARLCYGESRIVHDLVVWILQNVPKFEQSAFAELGLREPVLTLMDSPSDAARAYAAAYARTHARDLPLERLLALADNDHADVRAMAHDLLGARDARKDVGLDAWGRLLDSRYAHDLAAKALRAHFTARELTPEWFTALFSGRQLNSGNQVVDFAIDLLPRIHPDARLGVGFFHQLLDIETLNRRALRFALDRIEAFKGDDALPVDFVRRALLNPRTRDRAVDWLRNERVKAETLGVGVLKALADGATWAADPFHADLKRTGPEWARDLEFDTSLAKIALELLSDVRRFTPDQLGFDWLMTLVERTEPREHDFAVEYMTKAFVPADFAPSDGAAEEPAAGDGEINVDLEGKSFLFTGKLATMTRGQATKKVTTANGTNASGVNKKLDYLVIGDEGSSLYGEGRKGSKQVKAEKIIADGAPMRIISETAFLQMLAGKTRKADDDSNAKGLERLWEMLVAPGRPDAPLADFARHYFRMHHEEICPAETDRYVDPGAEIPKSFLTFDRLRALMLDERTPLRRLGIELARWELARLAPPMPEIVALTETGHAEVKAFVREALLADDEPGTRKFRVDPTTLTADAVYRFCESLEQGARALGMELIARNPRLSIPEELFRLTESPDRQVRAFVVRQLWTLYRDRHITQSWSPPKDQVDAAPPAPKPDAHPAKADDVRDFLRRTLFGIPPARLPKTGGEALLRPLPARLAKLGLIEVVRDLALVDQAFATRITPLLQEFSGSRGRSERHACLVALTRLKNRWPDLTALSGPQEAA